ncbi:MAG: hypothetical protein AUJ74_06805 [Candidatus Omnitrophica bacterium CG1_02_44_16]|nr:MAG: hypothetical protein AUJ74_06805 [Candidatus Omnitrophica bacterium CG1_02_44_16]PIY84005.1 MAG: hypothetical protein COY78_00110 [Candidatus Omnitrophica bacterium CG_4_10_14_0_8_um_filter_44_12]PIZ84940.1 MAG: hypothetical protein COX96_01205 [Candidatus Omnitrophica bacterium CG_4_10_14_0_2_um_filter_44_9]
MALRFFIFLTLFSWLALFPSLGAQPVVAAIIETYEEPEAGAWFVRQALTSASEAKNTQRLERLVDWLYKDGAVFVGVVLTEEEASGLKVYLPINKQSREQIFRAANRELVKSGYRSEDDTGQDTLTIWF